MAFDWRVAAWGQLGAALDFLDDAIVACPEELWGDNTQPTIAWYTVYHTLFWVDLYLSGSAEGFAPPEPYTLSELDPDGMMPPREYSKEEMREYLRYCRANAEAKIPALTPEEADRPYQFGWGPMPYGELIAYVMRHVQEHAAQVHLLIGQHSKHDPRWVPRAR